jgi:site-specific recombinase XerD
MQLRHPSFSYSGMRPRDIRIIVQTIQQALDEWLLDCEIRQFSERTISGRKETIKDLLNFFAVQKFETVGVPELKRFMAHLGSPHRLSDRGFDGKKNGRALINTPLSTSSIAHHYAIVRTFFRWMAAEELIDVSPFDVIAPPINREDQIQPFTDEEVLAIIAKAKTSICAKRDEAITLFLFDTGIRSSELVSLRFKDMDLKAHRCKVVGKGNKKRMIVYSSTCGKALWRYLEPVTKPHKSGDLLIPRLRISNYGKTSCY